MAINSLTRDTQYLGGYVKEVRYYEPWNEKVSCRHPIRQTTCTGSGKNRHCTTRTVGHYHAYDVDYHGPHWTEETTLGSLSISEDRYKNILHDVFKIEKPSFHDMNRHYHTIDGDMYFGKWDLQDETLVPVTVEESYENRPKASQSIYRFQEVDTMDIKQYKLFNYPIVNRHRYQQGILGFNDPIAEKKLAVLNAKLGGTKHVRVFILVFKNQPIEAGHLQERYWEGSNKNEFVITIGIDNENKVKWAYDFSWTEVEETKVETRDYLLSQNTLDLSSLVDFTYKEIENKWIIRNFHEFDILTIQPSMTAIVIIFSLTLLLNVGMASWIVMNEHDDDSHDENLGLWAKGYLKRTSKKWK